MNDGLLQSRQTQVTEQVAVLERTLDETASVWESLTDRLVAVTRGAEPVVCDQVRDPTAKDTELVPLAAKLRTLNRKLVDHIDHMRDTLNKLEL